MYIAVEWDAFRSHRVAICDGLLSLISSSMVHKIQICKLFMLTDVWLNLTSQKKHIVWQSLGFEL